MSPCSLEHAIQDQIRVVRMGATRDLPDERPDPSGARGTHPGPGGEPGGAAGREARLRRLQWRTALGYVVVLSTLVIPSALALVTALRAAEQRDRVVATYNVDFARAERLRTIGLELGMDVRAFIIREEPEARRHVKEIKDQFDAAILALRTDAGPEGRARLAEIEDAGRRYEAVAERVLSLPKPDRETAFETELVPTMGELRDHLDGYVHFKRDLIGPAATFADARFRRAIEVTAAAFLFAVGISVALAVMSARRLDRDYRREQATAARAERALAARDEILAIVAHDLRSPLSAINLQAGSLLRNPQGPNARRHASSIASVAARMEQLIRMLLDAARMEAGQLEVTPTDFPLAAAIRETLEQFSAQADEKAIHLEMASPDDDRDLVARADRNRVIQVLANLVDNALRFTPSGGRISAACEPADGRLLVTVVDDGPGIPPEHLPRVFERFWKGETGGKRGSGLGLYIAQQVVGAHGGRIQADNAPGRGARFSFTLPRAPTLSRPAGPRRPEEAAASI
jgi:signal transduction histidine kinase